MPLVLPAAVSQSLEATTSYLRALRAATVSLQDRINTDLTARMEEDAREASRTDRASSEMAETSGKTMQMQASAAAVDEVAEEEHYGEEAGEEDEV